LNIVLVKKSHPKRTSIMDVAELNTLLQSENIQDKISALQEIINLDEVTPFAVSLIACFRNEDNEELCELATAALEAIGKPRVDDLEQFNEVLNGYLDGQKETASSAYWAATMIGSLGEDVRTSTFSGQARTNLETAFQTAPDMGVKKRSEWALKRIA